MDTTPASPIVSAVVRHALTALAGYLLARGLLHPGQSEAIIQIGSAMLLGALGFGWSMMRAGKLGAQAKTISDLLDNLMNSVPASAVGPAVAPLVAAGTDPTPVLVADPSLVQPGTPE